MRVKAASRPASERTRAIVTLGTSDQTDNQLWRLQVRYSPLTSKACAQWPNELLAFQHPQPLVGVSAEIVSLPGGLLRRHSVRPESRASRPELSVDSCTRTQLQRWGGAKC